MCQKPGANAEPIYAEAEGLPCDGGPVPKGVRIGHASKELNTGNILDQEQAVAAKREDVLNSLSEIARKFRTRVGESLATVERHSTPLAEATTLHSKP